MFQISTRNRLLLFGNYHYSFHTLHWHLIKLYIPRKYCLYPSKVLYFCGGFTLLFFQYCNSNIGLFSITLLSPTLYFWYHFFTCFSSLLFLVLEAVAKRVWLLFAIARERATTIVVAIARKAINKWEVMENKINKVKERGHKPYKTKSQKEAKRLRAITFAIAKLE